MAISAITSSTLPVLDPLVSGQCRRQPQSSTWGDMEAAPLGAGSATIQQAYQQLSAFSPDNPGPFTSGSSKTAAPAQEVPSGALPSLQNPRHQGPLPPSHRYYTGYGSPVQFLKPTANPNGDPRVLYVLPTKPYVQPAFFGDNPTSGAPIVGFDVQA